jgi:hypothetical protein
MNLAIPALFRLLADPGVSLNLGSEKAWAQYQMGDPSLAHCSDIRTQHSPKLIFISTEILHMPNRDLVLRWKVAVRFLQLHWEKLRLQGSAAEFYLDLSLHTCVNIS